MKNILYNELRLPEIQPKKREPAEEPSIKVIHNRHKSTCSIVPEEKKIEKPEPKLSLFGDQRKIGAQRLSLKPAPHVFLFGSLNKQSTLHS